VYFGTSNPPPFQGNQPGTTYDPGPMDGDTTYFWRIDEVNTTATTPGALWSFTTQPPGVQADFDDDGDVDQEDFGHFQVCLSGSGQSYPSGCEEADFGNDGDVDLDDFDVFLGCMGGANQPPGC
jgi:hypothetical protein